MRNKRFLSTVVATALVATTMAMPVMAAEQSGKVEVDLTTKTGVLRVEVPTEMAIAVDQFEITQTGAQIASGTFDMTNKSEMAVKVDVTSTVTLGTGVNLVSTYNAAKDSTGNDAWLAVAAKTGASSYDDAATTDKTEDYYDLTDANANVKTFGDDKTAKQVFYLEKGTGAATYALAVPKDNKASVSYAQFYELTSIATQPTDDSELQAEVDKGDVYAVVTVNAGNDKEAVTKIAKGTTVASGTYANTNTYYTAAEEPSTTVTDGKLYVYASMGTAGEAAGFTYVGKLSNNKDTWTKDDINKINIAYNITGVTGTKFNEVKTDCTYGLYKEKPANAAPSIATTSYPMTANTPIDITVDLGVGNLKANGVSKIMDPTGVFDYLSGGYATYDASNQKITLLGNMVDACIAGNVSSVEVIFDDAASTSVDVSLTTAP